MAYDYDTERYVVEFQYHPGTKALVAELVQEGNAFFDGVEVPVDGFTTPQEAAEAVLDYWNTASDEYSVDPIVATGPVYLERQGGINLNEPVYRFEVKVSYEYLEELV